MGIIITKALPTGEPSWSLEEKSSWIEFGRGLNLTIVIYKKSKNSSRVEKKKKEGRRADFIYQLPENLSGCAI